MITDKEIIQMLEPEIPIKTYIIDNSDLKLASKWHLHDEVEIIYVLNGKMIFYINQEKVNMNSGDILFINKHVAHSSDVDENAGAKMCLLQFNPDYIYNIKVFSEYKYLTPFMINNTLDYCILTSGDEKEDNLLRDILIEITKEFNDKQIAYEISIKAYLYRLLTLLYRKNSLFFLNLKEITKQEKILIKLEKLMKYLEYNFDQNITVNKACDMLNLDYHYFCRLFKMATGKSFIQYLNYIRILEAEKLLLLTDKSITDIIMMTGFSSLSYFNRVFRKYKNCCPTEYRLNKL